MTVSNKSKGQFLCPECWSRLREIAKYQWSLDQFLDRTHCKSYIGQMRTESSGTCEEPPKRPRFSNSQTAVSIHCLKIPMSTVKIIRAPGKRGY